jgi:hypothetical protein
MKNIQVKINGEWFTADLAGFIRYDDNLGEEGIFTKWIQDCEDIRLVDDSECDDEICKERGWHYFHTDKYKETWCLTCGKYLDEIKLKKIEKLDWDNTTPWMEELKDKINQIIDYINGEKE